MPAGRQWLRWEHLQKEVLLAGAVRGVMVVTFGVVAADEGRLADRDLKLPVGALEAGPGRALGDHWDSLVLLIIITLDKQEVERVLEHVLVEAKVVVGVLVVQYHIMMIDSGFSKERVFLIIKLGRSCPSQSDKPISTI